MPEVNSLERALRDISALLDANQIAYMVIGGLANAKWGNPRATLDIYLTIWAPDHNIQHVVSFLEKSYTILVEKPMTFISETRVLPIKAREGQRIDVIFGELPFERDAIERAVNVQIGQTFVKFCTAEDLILLKIISPRPKDAEDVQGIVKFQKEQLDYNYLEPRIRELAELLEQPGIKQNWEKWKKEM